MIHRKLSTIPVLFSQWLTLLRGEIMNLTKQEPCPLNPKVMDTYEMICEDDFEETGEVWTLK